MRPAALSFAFASLLWVPGTWAQGKQAETLAITGIVRDSVTRAPIPGVQVSIQPLRSLQMNGPEGTPTVKTGVDGRFRFAVNEPGKYFLRAFSEGYREVSLRAMDVPQQADADVELIRLGSVSGRVVDRESGRPLAGIKVTALEVDYYQGLARTLYVSFENFMVTGPDGVFRIENLPPGRYYLEFIADTATPKVLTGDQPAAASSTAYVRQWWPSGRLRDLSQHVVLGAGVERQLPDIRLEQIPTHRISGKIRPAQCHEGEAYQVDVHMQHPPNGETDEGRPGKIPCGGSYTISNLGSGTYVLRVGSENAAVNETIQVLDRDAERDLIPRPHAPDFRFRGIIKAPDGFEWPALRVWTSDHAQLKDVDAAHTFEIWPEDDETVEVDGLKHPYYVKEVRYQGVAAPAGEFKIQRYALTQSLEIFLGDDGATLSGTVHERDKAVSGAVVLALPQPTHLRDRFPVHLLTKSDGEGRFAFEGVAPGEYRLLAVRPDIWDTELQKPGLLANLAAGGTLILLGSRASQTTLLEMKFVATVP